MTKCPHCGRIHAASVGALRIAQDSPYRSRVQRLYAATLKNGVQPFAGLVTPDVKAASSLAHVGYEDGSGNLALANAAAMYQYQQTHRPMNSSTSIAARNIAANRAAAAAIATRAITLTPYRVNGVDARPIAPGETATVAYSFTGADLHPISVRIEPGAVVRDVKIGRNEVAFLDEKTGFGKPPAHELPSGALVWMPGDTITLDPAAKWPASVWMFVSLTNGQSKPIVPKAVVTVPGSAMVPVGLPTTHPLGVRLPTR